MMRTQLYKPGKLVALIACVWLCFIGTSGRAQALTGLQNNFAAYQTNTFHEKLYLHTSKDFYLTGEILWFKVYNTDGSTNKMADVSKIAYVELLDNNHVPVMQAKIALAQGTGNGSFYLPFSITNGNYELRAYTNWMKNFDAGYFFHKRLTIINPVKSPPIQAAKAANYDIQFFPESGHLVNGLPAKVAFKITAPDGMGASCSGAIVSQQNDTVVRFKTLKYGMGSFAFTPSAQGVYKAVIKVGTEILTKTLPEISSSGYVMQATSQGGDWDVSIQSAGIGATTLYAITHNRSAISSAQSIALNNGSAHLTISNAKLNDGVNFITLFDDQQHPLCERLVFKRPARKLLIDAGSDAQTYEIRKPVNIKLATHSQDNKGLPASLSVSVYRVDSVQTAVSGRIAAYLWLNADVKGYIESPEYYLDNDNEETNQALDNLLLSQGWTQFDWTKIASGDTRKFAFMPEHTGPIVTGTMVNTLTNQPTTGIKAYLTVAGAHHQLYVTKSDSSGKLLFNTNNFYGAGEIVMQPNWTRDSTYRIDVTSPFSDQFETRPLPLLVLNPAVKNTLTANSVDMQVQNIFAAKQQKVFFDPLADSILFYGKPNFTYKLDDYVRFRSVEEVIHEYVHLVVITRHHGKMGFDIVNDNKTVLHDPLILLDGRPLFDGSKAYTLEPLKIKRLDVISTNYLYGSDIFNGIISFNTYSGQSISMEIDPRAVVLDYEGLQLERKFYSPVYGTDDQINSTLPDFRNVLYWNGNLSSNEQGVSTFNFYTGDKRGTYIGIVEGLTPNGEAGSGKFTFEVK